MPRLVIRVNSNNPTAPDDLQPSREIVEYHWHRIIAAGLVVALLIIGVCWLAYQWISATPDSQPDTPSTEEIFRQDAAQPTAPVELPQVAPAPKVAPATQVQEAPQAQKAPQTQSITPAQEADSSPLAPARPGQPGEPSADQATADQASPVTQAPVRQAAPDRPDQSVPLATVTIHSPRITRAQLTTDVVKDAPVDQLPARIPMNEQGLLRIYLFTESRGLQDRSLSHYWYLNGKQMARVRMPTSRQPIVASSSKFIDRYMTGNWEVKVMDDRKKLLASARFIVTQ